MVSRHPRAEASVFSIYVAGPQHPNSPSKWSSSNLYFRNFRGPFILKYTVFYSSSQSGGGELILDMAGRPFFFQSEHFSCSTYFVTRYFVDISFIYTLFGWTCGERGMQLRRAGGPRDMHMLNQVLDGRVAGEECSWLRRTGGPPDQTRAGIRRPQQQGTSHTFEPIIAPQMYVPQTL